LIFNYFVYTHLLWQNLASTPVPRKKVNFTPASVVDNPAKDTYFTVMAKILANKD